jgi:hypothetical protein
MCLLQAVTIRLRELNDHIVTLTEILETYLSETRVALDVFHIGSTPTRYVRAIYVCISVEVKSTTQFKA